MGSFDTIWYDCPRCGKCIEHQSRVGDCTLTDYSADSVPLKIADAIKGELIYCTNCNRRWEILVDAPSVVSTRLAQAKKGAKEE